MRQGIGNFLRTARLDAKKALAAFVLTSTAAIGLAGCSADAPEKPSTPITAVNPVDGEPTAENAGEGTTQDQANESSESDKNPREDVLGYLPDRLRPENLPFIEDSDYEKMVEAFTIRASDIETPEDLGTAFINVTSAAANVGVYKGAYMKYVEATGIEDVGTFASAIRETSGSALSEALGHNLKTSDHHYNTLTFAAIADKLAANGLEDADVMNLGSANEISLVDGSISSGNVAFRIKKDLKVNYPGSIVESSNNELKGMGVPDDENKYEQYDGFHQEYDLRVTCKLDKDTLRWRVTSFSEERTS